MTVIDDRRANGICTNCGKEPAVRDMKVDGVPKSGVRNGSYGEKCRQYFRDLGQRTGRDRGEVKAERNRIRRLRPEVQAQQVVNRFRRTAQMIANGIEEFDFYEIVQECRFVCYLCGLYFPREEWTYGKAGNRLTQDHVIAVKRGGPHYRWNVLPACRKPCQSRKGKKLLSELTWKPAVPPMDDRLWVQLAPGQLWKPA